MNKWDCWEIKDYQEAIEQARKVCAELYVILGELDAPEDALDNCLAITDSTKPPYDTILPFYADKPTPWDRSTEKIVVCSGIFIAIAAACFATHSAEPLYMAWLALFILF